MPDPIDPDEAPRETLTDVDASDSARPTLQASPKVESGRSHPLGTTQPDHVAAEARQHLLGTTLPEAIPILASAEATASPEAPAADTHPDEEPLDVGRGEPDAAPARAARKPLKWLYIALGSVLLLALTGPLIFYFFVWRYTPTAPHHIPAGTTIAVRFDGKQLYLYEPFRKNVLGALEGTEQSERAKGRAGRLKKHTGVDLKSDIREVIVATMTVDSWIVLIGGNFDGGRSRKFASSLKAFLDEEGVEGFSVDGNVLIGSGLFVAQAEDTTIMIANNREILRAASEPSDSWQTLGLSSSGAMSFVIDRPVFDMAARAAAAEREATSLQSLYLSVVLSSDVKQRIAGAASHTQKVTGHLELGRKTELHADVLPTSGTTPEQLAIEVQELQTAIETVSSLLPESGGIRRALLEAKVKPGSKRVIVNAPFDKAKLDAGLVELGAKIRTTFEEQQHRLPQ